MALGARSREEPIAATWDLPIRGVVKNIQDLSIPPNALYDSSNAELIDGVVKGRSGLTALDAQLFSAAPLNALNFWESGSAGWIILATTAKAWTKELSTGTWTDRGGSLTASLDNATRIVQFEFGTPSLNRAYIANGKDTLKTWKPGDASVSDVFATGNEKVSNGDFGVTGVWTYGTNWAWDNAAFEADHTPGNTAALEQDVLAVATEKYRVVFTVKNRTAGSVTPQVGGTAGTAVSSNTTSTQDITAINATNLKFVPTSDFNGSIDDVSVKKTSSAPVFKDLTVVADRLMGAVGTHEIRWGDPLTDGSFPELNSKLLTETPSPVVAVRSLGALGAVIYKKDAIWGVDVTGLSGGSAFRFNMVEKVQGPAGPNAVVDAGGIHVYMTNNGRIGIYTGFMRKWVADGIWSTVKAEIDTTKPNRVHGVYIKELSQVRFYYKRTGQTVTDGLVIVNLERKDLQLPWSAWPGRMGKSITASCSMEDDSFTTSLVFADNAGAEKSYKIEGTTDDGTAITSHMQTGLTLPSKLEVGRALSLEAFVERLAGYGTLTAKLAYSNVLDKIEGYLSASSSIDLTTVPVKNPIGFDVRGRFLALRLEWTSAATVRYRGANLRVAETTG